MGEEGGEGGEDSPWGDEGEDEVVAQRREGRRWKEEKGGGEVPW